MKIEIWGNDNPNLPEPGPYRLLDTVERSDLYLVGDTTRYGPVISFLPLFANRSGNVNQSVVVKFISPCQRVYETSRKREFSQGGCIK